MPTRWIPTRWMQVALVVVAVTAGIAAWRVLPASSGPASSGPGSPTGGLGPRDVVGIVELLHHDQQGIVLAHQAEAQSTVASTRARADSLAHSFERQARALTRVLDAHDVPPRQRLFDTTRLDVTDDDGVGCDIMPGDAVSTLAAAPPDDFDARFRSLMERHLVGGRRMAASVVASTELGARQLVDVRAAQRALS